MKIIGWVGIISLSLVIIAIPGCGDDDDKNKSPLVSEEELNKVGCVFSVEEQRYQYGAKRYRLECAPAESYIHLYGQLEAIDKFRRNVWDVLIKQQNSLDQETIEMLEEKEFAAKLEAEYLRGSREYRDRPGHKRHDGRYYSPTVGSRDNHMPVGDIVDELYSLKDQLVEKYRCRIDESQVQCQEIRDAATANTVSTILTEFKTKLTYYLERSPELNAKDVRMIENQIRLITREIARVQNLSASLTN